MQRTVAAHIDVTLSGPTQLVYSVAAAASADRIKESLRFSLAGKEIRPVELHDRHGGRIHQLIADSGQLIMDYECIVTGQAEPEVIDELDLITYLRPSRYCESDALGPTAASEFSHLGGAELLLAVTDWVARKLSYVEGSSLPTDGAARTLLSRQGVCRDYAHLVIALLRALNVPARLASVYAPGLAPMDFHAVAEAYVEGAWQVVDATRMAPRQSLLRIATGRDAADTAFLTNHWANLELNGLWISAVVDDFVLDGGQELISLR